MRWGLAVLLLACLVGVPLVSSGKRGVRLEVVITAADTGEPIENASVYAKFKRQRLLRKDKKVEWAAKADPDGKAVFPVLPEGRVLLQVVAKGWKTYGRYHTLKGPKCVIEIKLKRPKRWY
ncbi:MAG: carboxypeptidase-like regulatory domain-containing protein [Terriglobia bacterium]